MARLRLPLLALGCALALVGCQKASAEKSFDERVHAYLLAHPEVIQEAITKLQEREQADAASHQKAAIAKNRQAIEHDPRDFVANPAGKVTVTEFYDYRCPHCVNSAPAVEALIHDNPNVRFVFKEFPIFGAPSEKAAAGAIAVRMAGGDGVGVFRDLMAARPLDDAAIDRILLAHGVDAAKLDDPKTQAKIREQLLAVRALATTLGIEGTPAFIIGDTVIPGEDMDAVRAAAKAAGA